MHLGGDPGDVDAPPDEAVVTERMVELCAAAEEAFAELPAGAPSPIYVIGTEVPVPGGELLDRKGPVATRAADAERTLRLSRDALCRKGLQPAWNRVAALVVQPGVEFADDLVFEYDCAQARALSSFIENGWDVVFEAHSTDYQQPAALRRLVQDHFAILKVGPWLTFALREALFALARMEEEWLEGKGATLSHLPQVLDQAMLQDPRDWAAYYRGDERDLRYSRKYSYSDRSRYYWPRPAVQAAVELLLHNLSQRPAPLTLLSQFMSNQYLAVREGRIANHPRDWIHDKIREVLRVYADACSARRTG
jgi:D-tagatose-1,6-bisphosphate aldolase subunit GatZ/KbaZ